MNALSAAAALDETDEASPWPAARELRRVLASVDVSRSPDPDCMALRRALATRHGLQPEQVLVGNGTTELVHLLAVTAGQGSVAVVFSPSRAMYAAAADQSGLFVVHIRADAQKDFAWDVEAACARLRTLKPALVFLADPSDVTGRMLGQAEVEAIAEAAGDGILVLDATYACFVDRAWQADALIERGNVVVLHSMTHEFALAGLPLAYALGASRNRAAQIIRQRICTVNAAAQDVGVAALVHLRDRSTQRRQLARRRETLAVSLASFGFRVIPSATSFLLAECPDEASLAHELRQQGFDARAGSGFGMPGFVGFAVPTRARCDHLVAALRRHRARIGESA